MQIIRTVAIILIIFWVIPWIIRKVAPMLLKRFVEKKMGQFQQGGSRGNFSNAQEEAKRREGEVKIHKVNSKKQNKSQDDFEDVDFEEVDS